MDQKAQSQRLRYVLLFTDLPRRIKQGIIWGTTLFNKSYLITTVYNITYPLLPAY